MRLLETVAAIRRRVDIPGEADTTAVSHGIPKDLARHDVDRIEDVIEHLDILA